MQSNLGTLVLATLVLQYNHVLFADCVGAQVCTGLVF